MAVPRSRIFVFALVALGGAGLDLATKSWVFAWLGMPGGNSWWLIDNVFGFTTSLNEGALFGLGQGHIALFTLLSLGAAMFIVYFLFARRAAHDWLLTIAMGAVMAGILGNMYDRVGLPGLRWNFPNGLNQIGDPVFAVRDWMHFKIQTHSWPIFNIADSLLVCGVGLLMWHSLRSEPSSEPAERPAEKPIAGGLG
jgi:signal peptidase II